MASDQSAKRRGLRESDLADPAHSTHSPFSSGVASRFQVRQSCALHAHLAGAS